MSGTLAAFWLLGSDTNILMGRFLDVLHCNMVRIEYSTLPSYYTLVPTGQMRLAKQEYKVGMPLISNVFIGGIVGIFFEGRKAGI